MDRAELYEEIPVGILDELKFPSNYYQLSFEEQRFIDYFLDKMIEMRDNIRVFEERLDDTTYNDGFE
tara:strand:- start:2430 stop:2630 length:201 start_codon:yes stop_codon:yes gene_type:complete